MLTLKVVLAKVLYFGFRMLPKKAIQTSLSTETVKIVLLEYEMKNVFILAH